MKDNIVNAVSLSIAAIFTATQTNEILQLISIILTCIASVIAFAYNIYKWIKNAKKDGKIDEAEVDNLVNIVQNGIEDIQNKIK